MANDNHLFSVTCYNVTMKNHNYYNEFFELGQQKINFNFFELSLPDDDPVYTLKKVLEDLNFSSLLACYSSKGRSGYNPIMMYSLVTYANMRGVRAVDRIVELCERDLAFIWLAKGEKPKRDAFYDFKGEKLTGEVLDDLNYQFMRSVVLQPPNRYIKSKPFHFPHCRNFFMSSFMHFYVVLRFT